MITVQKLKADLDYWIHIGIGDDIVRFPDQREEYQHWVKVSREFQVEEEDIPTLVLGFLEAECDQFILFRPTFWRLNYLYMKWGCEWLLKRANHARQMLGGKKEV